MNFTFKNIKYLYLVIFILSSLPFIINVDESFVNSKKANEKYLASYSSIETTERLAHFVDSICLSSSKKCALDTSEILNVAKTIIENRFFHGLSSYSFTDNWIAYLSGKIIWSHFSAIVKSNDILKSSHGLCSQQTIVFLEVLRRKKIDFRTVGLGYKEGPGHFLCEVKYNGSWHLYDVTYEPNWEESATPHQSLEYYLNNKEELYQVYRNKMDSALFYHLLTNVEYGKANVMPGQNMALFHTITKALTYIIPLIFLILLIKEILKVRIGKD